MIRMIQRFIDGEKLTQHEHCWHALRGPIWMVVPDGHTVQKCCGCNATRTIHVDHAYRGCKEARHD